jgi:predicted  nucleic acid-binding Zn-ribbon protein
MALRGTYETLKQAFQDIIAPQLERINGQIEGLKVEMQSVRNEIQSVRNEMHGLEKRMEEGFASIRNELAATNKRLDDALDVGERLAALEGKNERAHELGRSYTFNL